MKKLKQLDSNMRIEVLCFGPLAEAVGWKSRQVTLPDAARISDLVSELGIEVWSTAGLAFAINGEMVPSDSMLTEGMEVALLPPVSGG
jgi:molybdopterin converting factor small subunit